MNRQLTFLCIWRWCLVVLGWDGVLSGFMFSARLKSGWCKNHIFCQGFRCVDVDFVVFSAWFRCGWRTTTSHVRGLGSVDLWVFSSLFRCGWCTVASCVIGFWCVDVDFVVFSAWFRCGWRATTSRVRGCGFGECWFMGVLLIVQMWLMHSHILCHGFWVCWYVGVFHYGCFPHSADVADAVTSCVMVFWFWMCWYMGDFHHGCFPHSADVADVQSHLVSWVLVCWYMGVFHHWCFPHSADVADAVTSSVKGCGYVTCWLQSVFGIVQMWPAQPHLVWRVVVLGFAYFCFPYCSDIADAKSRLDSGLMGSICIIKQTLNRVFAKGRVKFADTLLYLIYMDYKKD